MGSSNSRCCIPSKRSSLDYDDVLFGSIMRKDNELKVLMEGFSKQYVESSEGGSKGAKIQNLKNMSLYTLEVKAKLTIKRFDGTSHTYRDGIREIVKNLSKTRTGEPDGWAVIGAMAIQDLVGGLSRPAMDEKDGVFETSFHISFLSVFNFSRVVRSRFETYYADHAESTQYMSLYLEVEHLSGHVIYHSMNCYPSPDLFKVLQDNGLLVQSQTIIDSPLSLIYITES